MNKWLSLINVLFILSLAGMGWLGLVAFMDGFGHWLASGEWLLSYSYKNLTMILGILIIIGFLSYIVGDNRQ